MKRPLIAAAMLVLGAASQAHAFDLPPMVDAPEYTGSIASSSGWYIRGDLGYNGARLMAKPSERTFDAGSQSYSTDSFDTARLNGDYALGAGFGYQFNDWLRSDLTVDYFRGKFKGNSTSGTPCASQSAATNCGSALQAGVGTLDFLANGYVDLGTYWGLTPYLGAGAGVANVDWNKVTASSYCIKGGGTCNNFVKYENTTYDGLESWRFAYALMAGVSYDVSTNMKIDFGYKYSRIASGDMFDWSEFESSSGASGVKAKDKGFARHEFRVGLRLTGW
jgi:opacity protein-like surface antigen